MPLTIIMYLLNVIVLYYFVPSIFSHNIIILTDWNRSTLQCMKQFFETTKYLTKYDTNVIISGLDKKEESVVQSKALQNFNDLTSIYHKTDYFPQQEQEEKYYSKLIRLLNSSNSELLLFADKSKLNNYFQQKHKNVKIISCKNTNCENCEDQKPHALAIVNQVPETKDIDSNEQNQSKEASDKSWSDETIIGAKGSMLELSPFSVLTGIPGETVKLYFRVMNKHWLPLEYTFHCYDQMGLIRSVLPTRILLAPNSAPFDVTVVLEVLGPEGSIDQITFSVQQPELELIKVNFYIGKPTGDTTRPTIDYIFNGDCRFADSPHNCASEKWSIEATVQDDNSGDDQTITR